MKLTYHLFASLICLGVTSLSSSAMANDRYVTVEIKEMRGIGTECAAPPSFQVSFKKEKNSINFLKKTKKLKRLRVSFTKSHNGRDVARVITTSFNGKQVTVREVAVSRQGNKSCEFIFRSA